MLLAFFFVFVDRLNPFHSETSPKGIGNPRDNRHTIGGKREAIAEFLTGRPNTLPVRIPIVLGFRPGIANGRELGVRNMSLRPP